MQVQEVGAVEIKRSLDLERDYPRDAADRQVRDTLITLRRYIVTDLFVIISVIGLQPRVYRYNRINGTTVPHRDVANTREQWSIDLSNFEGRQVLNSFYSSMSQEWLCKNYREKN